MQIIVDYLLRRLGSNWRRRFAAFLHPPEQARSFPSRTVGFFSEDQCLRGGADFDGLMATAEQGERRLVASGGAKPNGLAERTSWLASSS